MGAAYGNNGQTFLHAHDWELRPDSRGIDHDLQIH